MTDRTAAHVPDGASQLDATDDGVLAPRPLADRTLGRLLVVLGLVGFAGSLALAIERYLSLVGPYLDVIVRPSPTQPYPSPDLPRRR